MRPGNEFPSNFKRMNNQLTFIKRFVTETESQFYRRRKISIPNHEKQTCSQRYRTKSTKSSLLNTIEAYDTCHASRYRTFSFLFLKFIMWNESNRSTGNVQQQNRMNENEDSYIVDELLTLVDVLSKEQIMAQPQRKKEIDLLPKIVFFFRRTVLRQSWATVKSN